MADNVSRAVVLRADDFYQAHSTSDSEEWYEKLLKRGTKLDPVLQFFT